MDQHKKKAKKEKEKLANQKKIHSGYYSHINNLFLEHYSDRDRFVKNIRDQLEELIRIENPGLLL